MLKVRDVGGRGRSRGDWDKQDVGGKNRLRTEDSVVGVEVDFYPLVEPTFPSRRI